MAFHNQMIIVILYLISLIKASDYTIQTREEDVYLIPKDKHTQTLIFMHGLGESPNTFITTFTGSNSPMPPKSKVILLSSPTIPVQCFNGATVRSWFNIYSLLLNENDYEMIDVKISASKVYKLIEKEVALLNNNYRRIFVGGFSQGGILSLHIGLNYQHVIGGVFSLSGILFSESVRGVDLKQKDHLPIFIGYGMYDERRSIERARKSYEMINKMKYFEMHEYCMEHITSEKEYNDLKVFIASIIKSVGK